MPLGHSATSGPVAGREAVPPGAVWTFGRVHGVRRLRADDGIRTRDPHLGKVMLYQLSHVRAPAPSEGRPGIASRDWRACQNFSRSWPASKLAPAAHRYYRLAGHRVAAAIEALSRLSPPAPVRSLRQSRQAAALARARTCYDHLAGQAGVALLDALLAGGVLAGSTDGLPADGKEPGVGAAPQARPDLAVLEVTAAGEATLAAFGVNAASLRHSRRRFAGACLDWTERRPHLNGALGAAITASQPPCDTASALPGPGRICA